MSREKIPESRRIEIQSSGTMSAATMSAAMMSAATMSAATMYAGSRHTDRSQLPAWP